MTGRSLGRHSMARFQSSESAAQDLWPTEHLALLPVGSPQRSKWVKALLLVLVAFTFSRISFINTAPHNLYHTA